MHIQKSVAVLLLLHTAASYASVYCSTYTNPACHTSTGACNCVDAIQCNEYIFWKKCWCSLPGDIVYCDSNCNC